MRVFIFYVGGEKEVVFSKRKTMTVSSNHDIEVA